MYNLYKIIIFLLIYLDYKYICLPMNYKLKIVKHKKIKKIKMVNNLV